MKELIIFLIIILILIIVISITAGSMRYKKNKEEEKYNDDNMPVYSSDLLPPERQNWEYNTLNSSEEDIADKQIEEEVLQEMYENQQGNIYKDNDIEITDSDVSPYDLSTNSPLDYAPVP